MTETKTTTSIEYRVELKSKAGGVYAMGIHRSHKRAEDRIVEIKQTRTFEECKYRVVTVKTITETPEFV